MNKFRNTLWILTGILLMSALVYATTTVTDLGISTPAISSDLLFSTSDTIVGFNGVNSLLGGTPSSGGIYFNQTVPEGKEGIWWYSYDSDTNKNRVSSWIVTHFNSSTNSDKHSHLAFETLDNSTGTPSINTKFAITYGASNTKSVTTVYTSDFSVNDYMYVNISGKTKFTPKTTLEIYPNSQSSYALQVSNSSSAIQLSVLGSSDLTLADNVTVTPLAGSGDAFACIDANGKLFRKATACA